MKKISTLAKVTIAAVVLTAVAMLLEIIFVRILDVKYESAAFMPVRLLNLLSANVLGGCIFTKLLKSTLLKSNDGELIRKYRRVSVPTLWVSAFLIVLDCVKDALLRPDVTTISSVLTATYALLFGVSALIVPIVDSSKDKVTYIAGAVMAFAVAATALALFAMSAVGDVSIMLKK